MNTIKKAFLKRFYGYANNLCGDTLCSTCDYGKEFMISQEDYIKLLEDIDNFIQDTFKNMEKR